MLLAFSGLYFLLQTFSLFVLRAPHPSDPPYLAVAFYSMTAINLVCLVALIVAGAYLWRLHYRGLLICNVLFAFEIVYFLANSAIGLALSMSEGTGALVGKSMAAAGGIGDMGLALQFVTAYPIIALIVLNIAYRKLDKREGQRA